MLNTKNGLTLKRMTEHELQVEQIETYYELVKLLQKIAESLDALVKKPH